MSCGVVTITAPAKMYHCPLRNLSVVMVVVVLGGDDDDGGASDGGAR